MNQESVWDILLRRKRIPKEKQNNSCANIHELSLVYPLRYKNIYKIFNFHRRKTEVHIFSTNLIVSRYILKFVDYLHPKTSKTKNINLFYFPYNFIRKFLKNDLLQNLSIQKFGTKITNFCSGKNFVEH